MLTGLNANLLKHLYSVIKTSENFHRLEDGLVDVAPGCLRTNVHKLVLLEAAH